jgi:hypothetical protein
MTEWLLDQRDLKKYPHFDPPISATEARAYATNKHAVATHTFFPFMLFTQRWTKFAKKGEKAKKKTRPIRYAARRDAYIFMYYRWLLSNKYEDQLSKLGLTNNVLAYRRVPTADGNSGKCNIHFAFDAIEHIRSIGDCCVITLDISAFFESLDHGMLKALWCRLLGVNRLSRDHHQVFKAITEYAVVNKQDVYERLGHFGNKHEVRPGVFIKGYLTHYRKIPMQLCKGMEFQEKIAGKGTQKTIIKKNRKPFGIPQGAPISDLLANLYLIDFDSLIASHVKKLGGQYYRYSDDILLVIRGGEKDAFTLLEYARNLIAKFLLEIKREKSSVLTFQRDGEHQEYKHIFGEQGKNGLEYLGFRYNGKKVYLRDTTLGNLRRKVSMAAKREATACAKRYPDKNLDGLKSKFNYERLIKQFGRVEDFEDFRDDYRKWTFWTYATRSSKVFGVLGSPIYRQLRNHRDLVRHRVDKELARAIERREKKQLSLRRSVLL